MGLSLCAGGGGGGLGDLGEGKGGKRGREDARCLSFKDKKMFNFLTLGDKR